MSTDTIKWGPVVQKFRWSRLRKYYGRYRYYYDQKNFTERKVWVWDRD